MALIIAVPIALAMSFVIFKIGYALLASFSSPMPPPPPTGEMRRVNLRYRCSICGAELKMTLATEELPDPPRHCQEDMDLVAPVE